MKRGCATNNIDDGLLTQFRNGNRSVKQGLLRAKVTKLFYKLDRNHDAHVAKYIFKRPKIVKEAVKTDKETHCITLALFKEYWERVAAELGDMESALVIVLEQLSDDYKIDFRGGEKEIQKRKRRLEYRQES
eukprot:UN26018